MYSKVGFIIYKVCNSNITLAFNKINTGMIYWYL